MDIGKQELNIAIPKMRSFLIVHEDEKLVIRRLGTELRELKKLVDHLSKLLKDRGIT